MILSAGESIQSESFTNYGFGGSITTFIYANELFLHLGFVTDWIRERVEFDSASSPEPHNISRLQLSA